MKHALFVVMLVGACQGMEPGDSSPEAPLPEGFKAGTRPQLAISDHPTETRMVEVKNGVESIMQAQTCLDFQIFPLPGQCVEWGPTAPPGFAWCGNDRNCYQGELVWFTEPNYGGSCFYAHPGPDIVLNNLGEFDGPWHINSYKSNMSRWSYFHDLTNYGGQSYPLLPGWNQKPTVFPNFGWYPSSLDAHN